jgi:hypothetical protein
MTEPSAKRSAGFLFRQKEKHLAMGFGARRQTVWRRRLALALVLAQVFLSLPFSAKAQMLGKDDLRDTLIEEVLGFTKVTDNDDGSGTGKGLMQQIEDRYHLNKNVIQEYGEGMNVSTRKGQAPEVQLFFTPTDPKPGQEVSARALPMYFSNEGKSLYFTWYLQRKECGGKEYRKSCDLDGNGRVNEEDWKIEAMRLIVRGGFEAEGQSYEKDGDDDGYAATLGGADTVGLSNDYCYIHDFSTGENYELASGGVQKYRTQKWSLRKGDIRSYLRDQNAEDDAYVDDPDRPSGSEIEAERARREAANAAMEEADASQCRDDGGTFDRSTSQCRFSEKSKPNCRHLFPHAPGHETADKSFGKDEEKFWGTDPEDPSTAQNGNKDEANLAGLGQDVFKWNYRPGDRVGVAVEGRSMIATKHNDASMMVMWALPKNKCPISSTGGYTEKIKGYDVEIKTASMDIDKCLEDNLVDPTEGGQAGRLEVSTSFSPENPTASLVSSENGRRLGDTLAVHSFVTNAASNPSKMSYDWTFYASKTGNDGDWKQVTEKLRKEGNVRNTQGAGLDSIEVSLNLSKSDFRQYFSDNGTGYLKVKVVVSQNFSEGSRRVGRSESVVRLTSNQNNIAVYPVKTDGSRLSLDTASGSFCEKDELDNLVCPVAKNGIVGLSFDDFEEYDSFSWTLNGRTLPCSVSISSDKKCSEDGRQGPVNFFPVTGNPGETYSVNLVATNMDSGKTLNVTRNFVVAEPSIRIVSTDENKVWRKYLGEYRDLDGNVTENRSANVLQGFSGDEAPLRTEIRPSFLKGRVALGWMVDGVPIAPSDDGVLALPLEKEPGSVYNVSVDAFYRQPDDIRRALRDIWGVSASDSGEIRIVSAIQIEVAQGEDEVSFTDNPTMFFATLASHVPASLVLFFRLFVTAGLVLFASGLALGVSPARRA